MALILLLRVLELLVFLQNILFDFLSVGLGPLKLMGNRLQIRANFY